MGSTPPDWLTRTTYAHRGLHAPGVPENSKAAALAAIERGLGIECDIQRSRDDHPMVFHDWKLDRLTNGTGETEDYLADELEGLSLVGTSQTPLRLQRFLEALEGRVPLLIEIKSQPDYDVESTALSVAQLLERYNGPAAVMSFDPRVPQWLAKSFPEICRGLVGTDSLMNGFEHVWRDPDSLDLAQPDFLAIDRRDIDRPEASEWRAASRPLLSWTIRTKQDWKAASVLADTLIAEGEALA
ncbi:MAG: glycerophosphodiester phosphodiesterase family protein [Pseudomonadota bacterium]